MALSRTRSRGTQPRSRASARGVAAPRARQPNRDHDGLRARHALTTKRAAANRFASLLKEADGPHTSESHQQGADGENVHHLPAKTEFPRFESPLTYMAAITGELVLGAAVSGTADRRTAGVSGGPDPFSVDDMVVAASTMLLADSPPQRDSAVAAASSGQRGESCRERRGRRAVGDGTGDRRVAVIRVDRGI